MQTDALAILLFATAFWNLRQQGLIDMAVLQSRRARGLFSRTEVQVTLSEHRDCPGLEGAIITNLTDKGTVREVISRWGRLGSTNPWHDAIRQTANEAMAEELLREPETAANRIAKFSSEGEEPKPYCERINALKEQFDAFALSWQEFQANEKLLYEQLCRQCKKSLMASAEYWIA